MFSYLWCEEGDLNSHDLIHMPLKHARLPIPPSSQNIACLLYILLLLKSRFNK